MDGKDEQVRQTAAWLQASQSTVAFTGAGISTESGIPDFRSPGGVWANSQPVYFNDFLTSATARHEYWRQKSQTHDDFFNSLPNAGHKILADWESTGKLEATITQNIDGLHQVAGSRQVLELHGTARKISCLDCKKIYDADALVQDFLASDSVPPCPACGGMLKHATVSFGQQLPEEVLQQAVNLAASSELFFAIGSSLVVHPAAGLPEIAKQSGAKLVIINRDPTPLDQQADLIFRDSIGQVLTNIATCLHEAS